MTDLSTVRDAFPGALSVVRSPKGVAITFTEEDLIVLMDFLGNPRHVVKLGDNGWTMAHPLRCRPNLDACLVHERFHDAITPQPRRATFGPCYDLPPRFDEDKLRGLADRYEIVVDAEDEITNLCALDGPIEGVYLPRTS